MNIEHYEHEFTEHIALVSPELVMGWVHPWVGLSWIRVFFNICWVGLGWVGLGWVGLGWVGWRLDCVIFLTS